MLKESAGMVGFYNEPSTEVQPRRRDLSDLVHTRQDSPWPTALHGRGAGHSINALYQSTPAVFAIR